MVIRIFYKDNVHDYVNEVLPGRFLDAGEIAKFQRRTGWVTVGIDPVRTGNQAIIQSRMQKVPVK